MPSEAPVFRVYRMAWWFRLFGILFLVIGTVATVSILSKYDWAQILNITVTDLLPLAFVLTGVGMTAHAFTNRVRFTQDAIEKCNLLGKKVLPLSAIRGRRECVVRGDGKGGDTRYLQLVSEDDRYPAIEMMKNGYNWDEAFRSWFESLDDLDARDKAQHTKPSDFGLV